MLSDTQIASWAILKEAYDHQVNSKALPNPRNSRLWEPAIQDVDIRSRRKFFS